MDKKNLSATIKDYQKVIRTLDKQLAMYEQLGTPTEIAKKLGVELEKVEESNIIEPDIRKEIDLNPSVSKKILIESKELVRSEAFTKSRVVRLMEGM